MSFERRVFVSVPIDDHLNPKQLDLKQKLLNKVKSIGYELQIFLYRRMPAGMAWTSRRSMIQTSRASRRILGG